MNKYQTPQFKQYVTRIMTQWLNNKLTVPEKELFFQDLVLSGVFKTMPKELQIQVKNEYNFYKTLN